MATPDINLEPVDIVNRALARFGGGEIMSLDDEGSLERQASLLYWTELEYALALHPWRFAFKTFKLSRLADPPITGYAYAYGLPGERLGDPVAYYCQPRRPDAPLREFHVEAGELHADAADVWCRCKVMAHPNLWTPDFRKAMIVLLASALCVPVTHDVQLAQALRVEAVGSDSFSGTGGLMGAAIAKAAALSPDAPLLTDDPLTGARWTGAASGEPWHGSF